MNRVEVNLLELFVSEIQLQCGFARIAYDRLCVELRQALDRDRNGEQRRRLVLEDQSTELSSLLKPDTYVDISGEELLQRYRELDAQHRRRLGDLDRRVGNQIVFFYAYSFLVHTAIVSKILWAASSKLHKNDLKTVPEDRREDLKRIRKQRSAELRKELKIAGDWVIEKRILRDDLEHYDERMEAWYLASPRHNSIDMSLLARDAEIGLDGIDFRRNINPHTMSFFIEGNDYDLRAMMREVEAVNGRAEEWLATQRFT